MNALTGFDNGKKVPYRLGHFFIAINIGHFTEVSEFKSTTGNILRELRNSAKMPGAERIYTAGEKEYIHLQERSLSGVPLNKAMRMEIRALAEMFKLSGYEHLY